MMTREKLDGYGTNISRNWRHDGDAQEYKDDGFVHRVLDKCDHACQSLEYKRRVPITRVLVGREESWLQHGTWIGRGKATTATEDNLLGWKEGVHKKGCSVTPWVKIISKAFKRYREIGVKYEVPG